MGFLDKLFGNKKKTSSSEVENPDLQTNEMFISTGDNFGFKIIRTLSEQQVNQIENSTILLRTGQLYVHYWEDGLVCNDRNDPEWQNKVMFFWKYEEPFPKRSLPPEFLNFNIKCFLFCGDIKKISFKVAKAMPWFGMPGLGDKHVCELDGIKITVPEMNKQGLVEYFEHIELTNDNLDILTNKEDYLFLIDESLTPFKNGSFYLKGQPILISDAYRIGGIHIIKKVELE